MKNNHYINNSPSRLNEIEQIIPINEKFFLIEYGPGSGSTLIDLKKKYSNGNVFGFDIAPTKLKEVDIPIFYLNLESHDSLIKYKDIIMQSDFHLFNDVIEHLSKPYDFLEIFVKMIKKKSIIIISCPNFKSIRFLSAWIKGTFPKDNYGYFDKTHLQWFSIDEFVTYFCNKKFNIVKTDYIYSKNKKIRYLQKIYPSRLCSQFQLTIQK